MNKILALFLYFILLCVLPASAQETLSFYDDFIDNRHNWDIVDDASISTSLLKGKYLFQNKETTTSPWIYKDIFLDPNKDFIIESLITQTGGVIDKGYGLVWGLDHGDNYYGFLIASNGHYKVEEVIEGRYIKIQPWTKEGAIHKIKKTNKLTIHKKGNEQTYYINDKKVFTGPFRGLKGAQIAFNISAMGIEVDYLKVKQDVSSTINLVKNLPTGFKKENLGTSINSPYEEKIPVIAPDGKTLYISRENHPQNVQGIPKDDIWVSNLSVDKEWQAVQNMGAPLNNIGSNFVISVTPDNNTLLLGNQYNTDGTPKGTGYSISHRTDSGWSMPTDVIMKNYVNKYFSTSSYLANNGKVIILSVEAEFSYGISDLYVSFLEKNGQWSEPKNLGPIVNSFGQDCTPFLAADGVTLYYSTNGKRGYGDLDIFKTTRLDETWTHWSEPENLGPDINSAKWDAYFTLPASGDYGLMISGENSIGQLDIFKIKLPEQLKPKPVVLVYGKVLDSQTKGALKADIAYNELKTNTQLGIAHASAKEGTYKMVLPAGEVYSFQASKENYYALSENIDLTALSEYKEIEQDLYLSPIEVGTVVRLNNIFFDTGKATLKEESFPELDRVITFLSENKGIEIELSGHTDDVGTEEANQKLSGDRATAVDRYLTAKGIGAGRVEAKGYGESKPVASNETIEGKQINRRVEFTITKK